MMRVSLSLLNLKFWCLLRNLKLTWKWKCKKTSSKKNKDKGPSKSCQDECIIVENDTSLHIALLLKRMKRQCKWLKVISNPMTMNL